jgi:hypothetical protein
MDSPLFRTFNLYPLQCCPRATLSLRGQQRFQTSILFDVLIQMLIGIHQIIAIDFPSGGTILRIEQFVDWNGENRTQNRAVAIFFHF